MSSQLRWLLLLALSARLLSAAPYSALRDGEFFRYRAGWGPFAHAGEITVSARYLPEPPPASVRLLMVTATRGFIHHFYHYENRSEAWLDAATGRIRNITDRSTGGDQPINATVHFDYAARRASYRDADNAKRNSDIPIPDGEPIDLLSALIQTRDWQLRPGDHRDALVYAGRDIYPVTIYAEKYETIRTPTLGTKETLMLIPRMEKQAPRGMFRQGGVIRVWVAQDATRLPVKMTLQLKFGTATLWLEEHGIAPPSPAAPLHPAPTPTPTPAPATRQP